MSWSHVRISLPNDERAEGWRCTAIASDGKPCRRVMFGTVEPRYPCKHYREPTPPISLANGGAPKPKRKTANAPTRLTR